MVGGMKVLVQIVVIVAITLIQAVACMNEDYNGPAVLVGKSVEIVNDGKQTYSGEMRLLLIEYGRVRVRKGKEILHEQYLNNALIKVDGKLVAIYKDGKIEARSQKGLDPSRSKVLEEKPRGP